MRPKDLKHSAIHIPQEKCDFFSHVPQEKCDFFSHIPQEKCNFFFVFPKKSVILRSQLMD